MIYFYIFKKKKKKSLIVGMVWYEFSDSSLRHLPLFRYSVLLLPSV